MKKLAQDIQNGKVRVVVVWRIDRLGRTALETLRFLDDLESKGIDFVSVREGIDTSTATGRLLRTILAGVAEFEREIISERIQAGVARAKKEGKTDLTP